VNFVVVGVVQVAHVHGGNEGRQLLVVHFEQIEEVVGLENEPGQVEQRLLIGLVVHQERVDLKRMS
jgi:hypothetical protein